MGACVLALEIDNLRTMGIWSKSTNTMLQDLTRGAVIGHQLLELPAGELAATVGVMQQRIGFTPSPDRHHQGIGDELRCHRSPHRPADNAPGDAADCERHFDAGGRGDAGGVLPFIQGCSDDWVIGPHLSQRD